MSDLDIPVLNDSTHTATVKTTPEIKKSRLGTWVALILFALVLGVSVFLWYEHQAIDKLHSQLASQSASSEVKYKALEEKVSEGFANQSKQTQSDITEITQRLDSTTSKVLALTNLNHDDWKLA